jgi:hypothetical protein
MLPLDVFLLVSQSVSDGVLPTASGADLTLFQTRVHDTEIIALGESPDPE